MLPKVALVGIPNVGKSTLFNRLTQTRDALVANFPGLTRDRKYGVVSLSESSFYVIDTGGVGVDNLIIDKLISKQLENAILESTVILWLVDAKAGLSKVDYDLAAYLRKKNKPIWIVANKIDGLNEEMVCAEFHRLGFSKIYPISAEHGSGVKRLLEDLNFALQNSDTLEDPALDKEPSLTIALVGKPNAGKSTLVNQFLHEDRMIVADLPGTTRDSVIIPFNYRGKKYSLIDTAGIRRKARTHCKIEKFAVVKTLEAIKKAQVVILLLDARTGFTDQDQQLTNLIIKTGKALVIAVNKWDGLDQEYKKKLQTDLKRKLHFGSFARVRFISALHGTGIWSLFKDLNEAHRSATQNFSTPKLTNLLNELVAAHPPPRILGRIIKLKYAHLGGNNPPIIIIHGNQLDGLPMSYKKYLTKAFVEKLQLVGTPLKLEFKVGDNPFNNS